MPKMKCTEYKTRMNAPRIHATNGWWTQQVSSEGKQPGSQIHLPWQFCLCQVQNTQNCPVVFSSGAWRRLTLGSDQEGKPQGIRRPGDISDVLLCLIYWPRWRLPVCICSVVIHRAIHVWEVCVLSQVLWWPNKKSFSEIVCRCRSHNS